MANINKGVRWRMTKEEVSERERERERERAKERIKYRYQQTNCEHLLKKKSKHKILNHINDIVVYFEFLNSSTSVFIRFS